MKTLLAPLAILAVTGAVLASAASAQSAPRHNGHDLANHKHALAKKIQLKHKRLARVRVCRHHRVSIRHEIRRLRHQGFRHARYQGRTYFRPRCALFLKFSACRGINRYNVKVRYINGQNRYVISQRAGICHYNFKKPGRFIPKPKLPNPGPKRFSPQG